MKRGQILILSFRIFREEISIIEIFCQALLSFISQKRSVGCPLYLELTQGKHVLCHTNRYTNIWDEENTCVCSREVVLA